MIDDIFAIINEFGLQSYGEDVSQLQHALQCAALARQDGAPFELVAAALLHDIGQFMDDAGNAAERHGYDARHEISGARYLARAFPPSVTEPIRLHVEAKRYLCAVEPAYFESLSRASKLSLALQGGPMSEVEASDFRRIEHFDAAIQLRRYDDAGKRSELIIADLESYRPILNQLLATGSN